MSIETLETTDIRDRIRTAYIEKDPKKFLDALRDVYCVLTDCSRIPQEIDSVLQIQLDPSSEGFDTKGFLDDPYKLDLEIPLQQGGDPHLKIYKEGSGIKLALGGEGITPEIKRKFKELGL